MEESDEIGISALAYDDIEGAVTCIQAAFARDPYFEWAFDAAHFSAARNRASLRTRCRWGVQNALFHVAKRRGKVLGVACWLPPTPTAAATPTWSALLRSYVSLDAWRCYFSARAAEWSFWANQLITNVRHGGRGGLNVRRYYAWKDAQAAAQHELWTDPHGYFFCNIVTILPEAQGKGIGRALMGKVLRMADARGRKCYLESSRSVPNVQIYKRMGFRLVKEMVCRDITDENDAGITLYCMMRDPAQQNA